MKKLIFTTLSALTLLAAGDAMAHPAVPVNGPGGHVHIPLTDFNCVEGDVLDENGDAVPVRPQNERQYHSGWHIGQDLANAAWMSGDMDPGAVEDFVAKALGIVIAQKDNGLAALDPADKIDNALGCRFLGTVEGAALAVGQILAEVVANCAADGDYWSIFAAGLYCEFAELAQGLKAPGLIDHEASVCGGTFELACEAGFIPEAEIYTSAHVPSCLPWLEAQYDQAVSEYRHNLCIYEEAH